jgi:hypothetical protein
MLQSLYRVLDVPSTATRDDIRAAYRRQLARIRSGEIPSTRRPLIERACTTLDDPERRVSYDVRLAQLPRWQRPELVAPPSHLHVLLPAIASSAAVVAVALAGFVFLASPFRSEQHVAAPLQAAAAQSQPVAAESSPPETVAADPAPSADIAERSDTPVDVSAPEPQPPAVLTARAAAPQRTTANTAPSFSARSAVAVPAEPAEAYTNDSQIAEQPAVDAIEAAAPITPALVQSSSYGKIQANSNSRLDFRVQGWFCSDASGGQVFVSAGAPLPSGVSCS